VGFDLRNQSLRFLRFALGAGEGLVSLIHFVVDLEDMRTFHTFIIIKGHSELQF
jgi:hypothetical protein